MSSDKPDRDVDWKPSKGLAHLIKACKSEPVPQGFETRLVKGVFSKLTAESHKDPTLYQRFAKRLAELEDYEGAIEAIREAIKFVPESKEYQEQLAEYEKKLSESGS